MDKNKHYKVLELDKVLNMLCGEVSMPDTAELVSALTPTHSIEKAKDRLLETEDAHVLMAKFGAPNFGSARNNKMALQRAASGGVLSIKELLDVGETCRVIRSLKEWREGSDKGEKYKLDKYFSMLTPNKFLEEKIFAAIRSEDELYDNASPELYNICRKIRHSENGIREKLDKIIRSQSHSKYLQDAIITMRNGRYVVPVKQEYRGNVPGMVHDTSASGATLFVEPAAIVEINNDLRILEAKRNEEIERILAELSADAGNFAPTILDSYACAVSLDLAFAKAKLAYNMRAGVPQLNNEGKIFLKNARHPLLDKTKVVPITVTLGTDYDTLIITGPNTGGKTVSLKTTGLFCLMAMCGLMIPAEDGSCVSVFENIFADIGDEQSIEQSLSTFSSHMKNIVEIISETKLGTLVLMDELGAGTDPVEGAALAESIISALREKGAVIAATTHYAELKSYALDTEGVENGCCEFDVATLRPTYKLIIGIPGRSNAFAISSRLGLDKKIVDTAKSLISDENLRFEKVVESLEDARHKVESERAAAAEIRVELNKAKQSSAKTIEQFDREKERIIEKAMAEARNMIERTRAETNRILNELEDMKKQARTADKAEMARKAKAFAKSGLNSLEDAANPVTTKSSLPYKLPRSLKEGDRVHLLDIDKEGTVLKISLQKNTVEVQAGIFKTRTPIENLILIEEAKVTMGGRKITGAPSKANSQVTWEIDLRGQSSDEALMELDKYIDHAVTGGIPSIRIIHGKGTGVLRSAVQTRLRRHKNIATFRLGTFGEGEDGVTIAEIK